MHKYISMDDMVAIILEQFSAGGSEVQFTPKGKSMLPMLRDEKDTVVLSKPDGKLKKYDLPLYKRDDGKYVLHRVIRVEEDGTYTMCGDNQVRPEQGIRDDQIIGVVTSYIKNGKQRSCSYPGYRMYCHMWIFLLPLRREKRFLRHLAGRVKRKIKSMCKCK